MAEITPLEFYLFVLKPPAALIGRVASAPSDPYMAITYNNGVTGGVAGSAGIPLAGNTAWFGTSAGGRERGVLRLRSWSPSNPTGTAGTLSVAESDDVGPAIQAGDYLTIKQDWRLWPIYPRIIQYSDTEFLYLEDYDVGWTDQTIKWRPVAVPGPPAVARLAGGQAQVKFIGDRSFALAPGATITAWLWTAYGSIEGSSVSQGTEASPVVFTYASAGQKLISLRVTDSNGKTHTAYTWVFAYDPNAPGSVAYTDFDATNDNFDFERGGGECSFTVHGGASVADFPQEALVVHACHGDLTTPTGSWPFRTNVLFVGYIQQGTIRQNPRKGDVSFQAATMDQLLRNLTMFPTRLDDKTGPNRWTTGKNLTVDRVASHLWHYRSTLAMMTPIVPMNYAALLPGQDFGPRDMYSALQDELVASAWGRVVCDHQGMLYLVRDYQLMTAAERAAVTTRKTLHKGIWVDDVEIGERQDYALPCNQYKMSGIYYPGSEAASLPLFSEAPGEAPRPFGSEQSTDRLILTGQSDLNTRCGLALARQNMRYDSIRMKFVNDGSFTVAAQEIFPANIEPGDNDRGLSWTPDLIPRRIGRTYDHAGGYFVSEVEFEPSASGPAGVTVVMPPDPPEPAMPEWDQSVLVPIWTPPANPTPGAAVAADANLGVYWSLTKGQTWQRRVNGLGTDQLAFRDLIWDPWWKVKTGGANPEQVILWGCGPGFIVRSEDAGQNWHDLTIYFSDPPNSWSDSPAPTVADLTFKQVHGDIHHRDTFYSVAEWQNTGSAWRGWLVKTADDGQSWTWKALGMGLPGADVVFDFSTDVEEFIYESYPGWNDANETFGWISAAEGMELYASILDAAPRGGSARKVTELDLLVDVGTTITVSHKVAGDESTSVFIVYFSDASSANVWSLGNHFPQDWHDHVLDLTPYAGKLITQLWWIEGNAKPSDVSTRINEITIANVGGTGELRPLGIDVDDQDGSRIYLTLWRAGALYLQRRSAASLALVTEYAFGAASEAEVAARTYHISPRTPYYPGVANFGNIVFAFGRYDDGGVKHIAKSTDGGVSFVNRGDATWTTERVGYLERLYDSQTLYAFLDAASPRLWRSIDGGLTWTNLNSLPFNVENESVSLAGGAGAEFLIANNVAAAQMAAYQATPYGGAWINATGPPGERLPTAADGGGGIVSIIWV
jgi:hypothetical protein